MNRSIVAWLAVGCLGVACTRPVDRPTSGETLISELSISPRFLRAGVPLEISFRLTGATPSEVEYELAGEKYPCTPTSGADGRFRCIQPGIEVGELPQGTLTVVVRVVDDNNRVSTVSGQLDVDFDCPRLAAAVDPKIAQPGDTVDLRIDAEEVLGQAPEVTREGRPWTPVVGEGQIWRLSRTITESDPALSSPIRVRVVDRAGNSSADCDADALVEFAVDQRPPAANPLLVELTREAPGEPSRLSADPGAFSDDVEVTRVEVRDDTGAVLATLQPDDRGGIPETSLGVTTPSRVLLVAIDTFGRASQPVSVRERWRLSVGSGATAKAAVRTAVRFTPAEPNSQGMRNRTSELALDLQQADARIAVVRATIGFENVGNLAARYEETNYMMSGYDPYNRTIVAAGGYDGPDYAFYSRYVSDTLLIKWDEREGQYAVERGPSMSFTDENLPNPRYGINMAFDDQGCGIIVGGDVRSGESSSRLAGDVWQICGQNGEYQWTPIPLPEVFEGITINRFAPITWDATNRRFVMVGAGSSNPAQVLFLEPAPTPSAWRWVALQPLPTAFGTRSSHFLFYDPRIEGFAVGSGFTSPSSVNNLMWTYRNGAWTNTTVPFYVRFRRGYSWGFDSARGQLVMWGGNTDFGDPPEPEVTYLTMTSTHGADAWRETLVDHPAVRDYPSMVWDSDREVMVVFGGVRRDGVTVPADINQLISQPSFPYLQASIDLGAERPKGIERLSLSVRAFGIGDADSVGPGAERGSGVRVLLYDHELRSWVQVNETPAAPPTELQDIEFEVTDRAERFVSPDGVVPVSVVPQHPATEDQDGRLEVDRIDGEIFLRPGVSLP